MAHDKVSRVGGRVLIVDASDRVLLIHERLELGGTHWITPGGGVEGDEDFRDTARREAIEEVGIDLTLTDADVEVLTTRRDWSWDGVDYDQVDHFYLARVPDGTPARPRALTAVESQTWIELRWWTVDELVTSSENLVPPDLGAVLRRLLDR